MGKAVAVGVLGCLIGGIAGSFLGVLVGMATADPLGLPSPGGIATAVHVAGCGLLGLFTGVVLGLPGAALLSRLPAGSVASGKRRRVRYRVPPPMELVSANEPEGRGDEPAPGRAGAAP